MTNPLARNPFHTRDDMQLAVTDLWAPVRSRFSAGSARASMGGAGAVFADASAELEGFARPLWGLAPLAAGGGEVDWTPIIEGLSNGTDPSHPEYWGAVGDLDQRTVELAAIGFALALVPSQLWDRLSGAARDRLAEWLAGVQHVKTPDNNWYFFRVLGNLGLAAVGSSRYDEGAVESALNRLDEFYLGGGWYSDGPKPQRDYYVPWAMHVYGLIYAQLAGDRDPVRAAAYRERAAEFAADFAHWFADDGAALPFGRSLTYRFAQGSFWGALAFAGVDALPWGAMKGLLSRHLRWWSAQPIADTGGALTVGYAYPNLNMAEDYNSPGSPYWAMKAFLPLALPSDHPFWTANEEAHPVRDGAVSVQPHAGMTLAHDGGEVVAVAGGQAGPWARGGAEKYAKFAYSTRHGFSVPTGRGLSHGAIDGMLAVSEDELAWHVRRDCSTATVRVDGVVHSAWSPVPGVEVETWLQLHPSWHVRVHRVTTDRALFTAEGGYALDRTGDEPANPQGSDETGEGWVLARYPAGMSGIRDLGSSGTETRVGEVVPMGPNSNVVHPRTVLPVLRCRVEPGITWLACAVFTGRSDDGWHTAPAWPSIE